MAASYYRRAIELYPAYAEPHMGIGDAYTYAGDFPAAIDWYRAMVARNPGFAVGYYALGRAYESNGDSVNARLFLDRAHEIDPTFKQTHK